jgi:transposase
MPQSLAYSALAVVDFRNQNERPRPGQKSIPKLGFFMPWMKPDVREQREQFVIKAKDSNQSFKSLCSSFGISRQTGYLWLNRYIQLGNIRDLSELQKRPHHSPNKTQPDVESQVVQLRDRSGSGASSIALALRQRGIRLAPSTVNRILHRHGRTRIHIQFPG